MISFSCLTIERTGQHILVLAPPTTVTILSGFRVLVKVLWTPLWPTTTGQNNPNRAATGRAPRSVCLPDSCERLTPRIGHPLHR